MSCFWSFSCVFNKYTLQYIAKLGEIRSAVKVEEDMDIDTVPVSHLVKQCDCGDTSHVSQFQSCRGWSYYTAATERSWCVSPLRPYTSLYCPPVVWPLMFTWMLVVTPFNSTRHFLLVNISQWMLEGSTEVGRKEKPSVLSTPSMGLRSVASV